MMGDWAKLITAIAAALAAIAWPLVFVSALILFRREMRSLLTRFPAAIDRLREMKVAGMEAKLDALANNSPNNGEVTAEQTQAAAQLVIESRNDGSEHIFLELDKLCLQYDTVRRTMRAGTTRTQEMTRIIVKMRALGPAASFRLETYKGSGSAGSRLAAIAMMQMEPGKAELNWLLERFSIESPFVFYHAALAITNVANYSTGEKRIEAIEKSRSALKVVRSFGKTADRGTVDVLEQLAAE